MFQMIHSVQYVDNQYKFKYPTCGTVWTGMERCGSFGTFGTMDHPSRGEKRNFDEKVKQA